MSLSSEFVKRLNDEGEPIAKRLCLARNAFQSTYLPIQRKEELVFGWLCSNENLDKSSKEVWTTLQLCICSRHMKLLTPADVRPEVLGTVVKMLCKYLRQKGTPREVRDVILECVVQILGGIHFQQRLKKHPEEYLALFIAAINLVEEVNFVCCHLIGFNPLVVKSGSKRIALLRQPLKTVTNEFIEPFDTQEVSFDILKGIIQVLIYLKLNIDDFDPDSKEINFSFWLQTLILSQFCEPPKLHLSVECLETLSAVIRLNPLAIEPKMFEILGPIMVAKKNTPEVRWAYISFLHCVIEMFTRLSRTQKFVTKLFPMLKEYMQEKKLSDIPLEDIFPAQFYKEFRSIMAALPSTQLIRIMKGLTYHLNLETEEYDVASKIYIQIMASIISSFLCGIRVASGTVPVDIVAKFINMMTELKETLARFAAATLCQEYDDDIMLSLLDVCFSWGELHILLVHYRLQQSLDLSQLDTSATNLAGLHNYLSSDQWNLIAQRVNNFGKTTCKDKMNSLLIQKLQVLQLMSESRTRPEQLNIARYLVSGLNQTCSAKFLPSMPFMSSLLSKDQLLHVAKHLVQEIVADKDLCKQVIEALKHEDIQEERSLMETMIFITLERIGSLISKNKRRAKNPNTTGTFLPPFQVCFRNLNLQSAFLDETNKEIILVLEKLGSLVSKFCEKEDEFGSVNENIVDMTSLIYYLNILKVLPITYMTENIQLLVCLSTIAVGVYMQTVEAGSEVIQTLFGELLLNLLEQTSLPNLHSFLHIGWFMKWLAIHDLGLEKERSDKLYTCLLDSNFKQKDGIVKLKPLIHHLSEKDNCSMLQLRIISILLKALSKGKKRHYIKNDQDLKKLVVNPLLKLILSAVRKGDTPASETLETYTQLLRIWLSRKKNLKMLAKVTVYMSNFFECALAGLGNETKSNVGGSATIFLEATTPKEFQKIMESLLDETRKTVSAGGPRLETVVEWWKSVACCDTCPKKAEVRQSAMGAMCLVMLRVVKEPSLLGGILAVLGLEQEIIKNTQVQMEPLMVDLCMESVFPVGLCDVAEFTRLWSSMVQVTRYLLTYRSVWVLDRLPSFLACYRHLVSSLAINSVITRGLSPKEVDEIAACALALSKLTKSMKKHSKSFKRVSAYLVADILHQLEQYALHKSIKLHFTNCMYAILSMCDSYSADYLVRVLPPSTQLLFKSFYTKYKNFHKFTGKV
uniref:Nucleolar 27S pre-rRNA processing Urb2/Npa2 C-terminal domain-containing protein n=1 Tax=Timema bartmani TaxID=61472 RepID=A0A7R9EZX4_9NEOP|nr:unnamed protein product [Timema bartmani]